MSIMDLVSHRPIQRPLTLLALGTLMFVLGACALAQLTSGGNVSGRVHVGPQCGIATQGDACADAAWVGGEVAFNGGAKLEVAKTDSRGVFSLELRPGTYAISLTGPNPRHGGRRETLASFVGPRSLDVKAGKSVDLDFRVATGVQ
jgi:hypothetical protein